MDLSYDYFRAVVDSLTDHLVVIDNAGVINYVNPAWTRFAVTNGSSVTKDWVGANYLTACDAAAQQGDELADEAAHGIRRVVEGVTNIFSLEYPCHSKDERRWFMMRVTPLFPRDSEGYVISHQDITARKLGEEETERVSLLDGLTNVSNRRCFDDFLDREWRRCKRLEQPISLIMLDIDHFKLFNDQYGHPAGDDCLKSVASMLKSLARRPSDLTARYGGEEFAVILGNTNTQAATEMADSVLQVIRGLAIPHAVSAVAPIVTASLGVATIFPRTVADQAELIKIADRSLYAAKKRGRNRIHTYTGLDV